VEGKHATSLLAIATRFWRAPRASAERDTHGTRQIRGHRARLVRELPHIAYRVDDFNAAYTGEKVLLGPFNPAPRLRVVFLEKDGAVIEIMEFESDSDLPWKG
jgi:hypothetical protein